MIGLETAAQERNLSSRWLLVLCVLLAAGLASAVAVASTAEERAVAEALFRHGKELMRNKQYSEACRKLEESQRLDPRDGTLLNLAVCHERENKIATAWMEYEEALVAARRTKRWDRVSLAQRRLKALTGKVPNLTIDVPPSAAADGLELRRNGVLVAQLVWGTAVPVDPGEHVLEATAPQCERREMKFKVEVGETKTVLVPPLQPLPLPKPKAKPKPQSPKPKPKPESPAEPDHTAAYVVGGLGVLATGGGIFFGLRAMSKSRESDEHCRGALCDQAGLELNDEADSAARMSNIAFGVGIVGLGVGTYMLLTGGNEPDDMGEEDTGKLKLSPVAGPERAAILVRGRW